MQKNFFLNCFLLASWRSLMKIEGSGSISQRHGSADPDQDAHQNVMDPQHWFLGKYRLNCLGNRVCCFTLIKQSRFTRPTIVIEILNEKLDNDGGCGLNLYFNCSVICTWMSPFMLLSLGRACWTMPLLLVSLVFPKQQSCGSGMICFRIRIRIRTLFLILHEFFLKFLTYILPLYSCLVNVRLLIMMRYKLFRGIFFWQKGIYIFKLSILLRNCQILPVFQTNFTSNSFRIGSCSDPELFFPDPDLANSFGSVRIRIHNTAK